ncbi:alpha/beta hydrolase [Streptomyces sp. NBC_01335]|uniref:alpha/beta fold hydrolase n=1 Tax=Streptomyces sp. NBC_01335 TaxID=2903828 RepID=UPI002E156EC5|nr:alpha/beta hydrolase [Streptomyces sp. NBC_01335]
MHVRRIRSLLALPAVAGLLALTLAPHASAAPAGAVRATVRPTIVLEHGAFADASGWNAVSTRLQRAGYTVLAPANPLRGLASDAAYLSSVLATVDGPIVLVGHSYGGAVISQAAAGNPQVEALVFIAALMPDKDENLGALAARSTESQLTPALRQIPTGTAEEGNQSADLFIDPALFRDVFAADLPPATTRVMAAAQRPVAAAEFGATATAAAWRTIPSWALVARQDKTLGSDLERFEARRAQARTVEINSSHAALVSHPGAVLDLIEAAVRYTATKEARPRP